MLYDDDDGDDDDDDNDDDDDDSGLGTWILYSNDQQKNCKIN